MQLETEGDRRAGFIRKPRKQKNLRIVSLRSGSALLYCSLWRCVGARYGTLPWPGTRRTQTSPPASTWWSCPVSPWPSCSSSLQWNYIFSTAAGRGPCPGAPGTSSGWWWRCCSYCYPSCPWGWPSPPPGPSSSLTSSPRRWTSAHSCWPEVSPGSTSDEEFSARAFCSPSGQWELSARLSPSPPVSGTERQIFLFYIYLNILSQ